MEGVGLQPRARERGGERSFEDIPKFIMNLPDGRARRRRAWPGLTRRCRNKFMTLAESPSTSPPETQVPALKTKERRIIISPTRPKW